MRVEWARPYLEGSTQLRGFSKIERALFFLGLVLISLYVGNRIYSVLYSHVAAQRFWMSEVSAQSGPEVRPRIDNLSPNFHLWSEKRIHAYQASLLARFPAPLAVLQIPSLDLQVPVLEGTDDITLDRALGHILGTAEPGNAGNIGIAGHRDGYFRALKDLQIGQTVDLYSRSEHFRYIVHDVQIVLPTDISVLRPQEGNSITLVTCYPFYFVGSAPQRYIVHAEEVPVSDH